MWHSVHLLMVSLYNYISSWPIQTAATNAKDSVPSGPILGRGAERSSLVLSLCSVPTEGYSSWQLSEERLRVSYHVLSRLSPS